MKRRYIEPKTETVRCENCLLGITSGKTGQSEADLTNGTTDPIATHDTDPIGSGTIVESKQNNLWDDEE